MRAIQESTYKTKSFVLVAALEEDQVLMSITLEDLENGASYRRDYREEDVGGQINAKVEIEDIFNVFKGEESDVKNEKEKEPEEYIFGTEIKNSENASFAVRADGEIKVTISTKPAGKVREYVSELRLEKTRDIPEGELLSLKVTTFKN